MNIAGKGVLLIIAVIAMGIIVLNEGFDNEASSTFSEQVSSGQQEQSQEEPNQEEQQVAESYFGAFHVREKRMMKEERALMEGGG